MPPCCVDAMLKLKVIKMEVYIKELFEKGG
jgi:hypothetical protein